MFRSAPFGLKHVSSHFMRVMKLILNDLPNVHVYADDIVIGTSGNSMEAHYEAVSAVIDSFHAAQHDPQSSEMSLWQKKRSSTGLLHFCKRQKPGSSQIDKYC
ncbi:hypothetical protein RMCBS344292_08103 [Rhizopus microsporus]|nr:hypothetical protein RMCBS344292_08103 [Rhizopus microsporus]